MHRVHIHIAATGADATEGMVHVFGTDGPVLADAVIIAEADQIAVAAAVKEGAHTVEIGILCEFRYGRMESQVHDG